MVTTRSCNFLDVCVQMEIMARLFKVSHWSYIQFIRRNISYIYVKVNEQKAVLKPFVSIDLFLKCFQNICAFSVIHMFLFIRILIKGWMIISGIDICFVAHLNNMAEANFLPDNEQCLLRTFTFANLILMTVLLCLQ